MQLVVRGVRRPVRLGEPESSLTDRREAMAFRAHAPPHGVCDYIALGKSAAGRGPTCGGAGGESPRTKLAKDDGRASKVHHGRQSRGSDIGDLEKTLEALSVVEPRTSLKEDFPGAALRKWVEELALRRGEEGTPPLVGMDWHAICQAIFRGIAGEEWERVSNKYVE